MNQFHPTPPHGVDQHILARAEAVLEHAKQTMGMLPVSLEIEHRIHHMLQQLGTGYLTVLGDVPHQEEGRVALPCGLDAFSGHGAHLGNAAGQAVSAA